MGSRFHHVQCMGAIWRIAPTKFNQLKIDIARGVDIDLDNYGIQFADSVESLEDMQATAAHLRRIRNNG